MARPVQFPTGMPQPRDLEPAPPASAPIDALDATAAPEAGLLATELPLRDGARGSGAGHGHHGRTRLAKGTGAPLARYVVRRELARGGMGRISIADDVLLGRQVALKELLVSDPGLAARFDRELALTARLQHPSIVSIHDGGTWPNGDPYYVMKLISGEPLDRLISGLPTVAARMALLPHGLAVADAIAYAHAQGIVHRDLKPANVLVGDFGETVVIDWGLAKDLRSDEPSLPGPRTGRAGEGLGIATSPGEVMGTPAYMPREQARGEALDERADVYAIGAILYHLISGGLPYPAASVAAMLAAVCAGPAQSLAVRASAVPADLAAIVDKAMAWDANDRYPTAAELAADLRRFQSGQLVGAFRYSARQLMGRWVRAHRPAVVVGAVAAVVLTVGAVAGVSRVVRERDLAQRARLVAEHDRAASEATSRDAEGLANFMLTTMRDQLVPIGKKDVLKDVATQVRTYYDAQPQARGPAARAGRALAQMNLGDVALAQGSTPGAAPGAAPGVGATLRGCTRRTALRTSARISPRTCRSVQVANVVPSIGE